jgi:hypothetical protein
MSIVGKITIFLLSFCFGRKFISTITESTDSLPLANTPEVFGLHPNAEINYYSQATREIWNHLIELQPQTGEFRFFVGWKFPSFYFLLAYEVIGFSQPIINGQGRNGSEKMF